MSLSLLSCVAYITYKYCLSHPPKQRKHIELDRDQSLVFAREDKLPWRAADRPCLSQQMLLWGKREEVTVIYTWGAEQIRVVCTVIPQEENQCTFSDKSQNCGNSTHFLDILAGIVASKAVLFLSWCSVDSVEQLDTWQQKEIFLSNIKSNI